MLRNWLKIAIINYKKNWLSTFINVFGLTVGLTGFILILMYWNDEESFERWNPQKGNVYYFQPFYKKEGVYRNNISYPIAYYSLKKIPEITDFALIGGVGTDKFDAGNKSVYSEGGMTVSEHFFNVFPFQLKYGNYQKIFTNKQDIALSSNLSEKLFGNQNPIGKTVRMEGRNYFVKAVYELPKSNSDIKPEFVFYPKEFDDEKKNIDSRWGNYGAGGYFILKPGADPKLVAEKIMNEVVMMGIKLRAKNMSADKYLELYGPNKVVLTRLDKIKLHSEASFFERGDLKSILILFAFSILIIVLSAINFINLKTAQASQRAKEVGVRKALGSSKSAIIVQFFMETLFLCLLSYGLALVLVELFLPSFNEFMHKEIQMDDWRVYVYSLTMVFIIALISGLIPSVYLSNFKPINTLKGNFARGKSGTWLRNSILAIQFVISSFFIIVSLIVSKQTNYMMNKDLGFNGNQILFIVFNEYQPKPWLKYERLKTELARIPGVVEVSYGEASPNSWNVSSSNVDYQQTSIEGRHGAMDYNFLNFLGVKLKKGRWLNPKLASDTINTTLVNEALVKKFGWTDDQALEREIRPGFDSIPYKIVGIVNDFNLSGVENSVEPVVFFHYRETPWKRQYIQNLQVKIDKNDIAKTQERIKNYWESKVEVGYPFTSYFIDKNFAKTFEKYQKQQTLFTILNAVVLIVALLGLFALSSLLIDQKLKDVAIKKTLGASEKSIVFDLTKKFLWISAIAVIISIPISYYFMNEWLKDFAYRIDMPWFPYVLSFLILLVLTFAVVSIKAYRATQVNLVKCLKYE